MTEPVNRKPASSKKSVNEKTELSKHRKYIADMERLFSTADPRKFTEESIDACIKRINNTIAWIVDNLDGNEYDKKKLRKSLHNARIKFAVAIEELKKGRMEKCYNSLEAGREHLEQSLKCW